MPTEPVARSAQCVLATSDGENSRSPSSRQMSIYAALLRGEFDTSLYTQESQSHAAPLPNYGKLGKQVCRLWFTSPRSEPGAWRAERARAFDHSRSYAISGTISLRTTAT